MTETSGLVCGWKVVCGWRASRGAEVVGAERHQAIFAISDDIVTVWNLEND
jgi:hypothetical protein